MTIRQLAAAVAAIVVVLLAAWLLLRDTSPAPVARAAQPQGTVLIIPGYGGGTGQVDQLADRLSDAGLVAEVISIGDGTDDLRGYARTVSERAGALVAADRPTPDLIGFSAGGLVARIAATQQPDLYRKVITLGSPHQGTTTADTGALFGQCPASCQQMRTDSSLLTELPAPAYPDDWLSVWSDSDVVIRPVESSQLTGAADYRLQEFCAGDIEHDEIPTHVQSIAVVSAFLSGGSLPTTCLAG